MISRLEKFTSAGAIGTGEVCASQIILSPAAAVATAEIKEGGTGGTVVLTLQAAANGGSVVVSGPIRIRDPYLSTLSGAGASLSVAK